MNSADRTDYLAASGVGILSILKVFSVLAAASLLPLTVHHIPFVSDVPIGAMLIPIFYVPFIAAMTMPGRFALVAALFAPLINAYLTGAPDVRTVGILTTELFVFTGIAILLASGRRRLPLTALISYFTAKFFSCIILGLKPSFMLGLSRQECFVQMVTIAFPGIMMLAAIDLLLVSMNKSRHNQDDSWFRPANGDSLSRKRRDG